MNLIKIPKGKLLCIINFSKIIADILKDTGKVRKVKVKISRKEYEEEKK